MIKVLVNPSFPEAILPLLEHPRGVMMCCPMTAEEVTLLGESLNQVAALLEMNTRHLRTLLELAASQPDQVRHLHATAAKMLEPAEAAVAVFDQARQIIGRAAFSKQGNANGKGGKLQ